MKGWKRKMFFDETGLPWVPPSPNMPTLDTALVYPGMCLLEATNISEGRGTTKPFEFFGAPYLHAEKLAEKLNKQKLPGVFFRPLHFKPNFQKWAGQNCQGAQVHVTDRKKFKSYLTGTAILKTIFDLYPNNFAWRDKPYEFVTNIPAIDLLSGSGMLRKQLESGAALNKIGKNWPRKKYLLY